MESKVADRYVRILTYAIDKIYRKDKNGTFDKDDIFTSINGMTDKTYKNSMNWFTERYIFEKIGRTYDTKYKLHNNFKFKLSKSKDTVIEQCIFIIGQLGVFSDKLFEDAAPIYDKVILNTDLYELMPIIKQQSIKDIMSEVVINDYNKENKGAYPYELLQTMVFTKSPFTVQIKNSQINIKMKSVKLKKITFNTDTVILEFKNSKLEVESLGHIKLIDIPKKKDLRDRVEKSLIVLEKYDNESVEPIIEFFNGFKVSEDIFFQ